MKRSKKTFACLVILSTLTLTSCLQKTTSTRNSSSTNSNNQGQTTPPPTSNPTPPPPTGSGNDPDAPGIPDQGQETPYYTLSNIIVKGRANPAPPTTAPFWSSANAFSPPDDHIFTTDARFNLRVIARDRPSGATATAADGSTCAFSTPYEKLKVAICVRAAGGSCNASNTKTFTNLNIDFASNKQSFVVPSTNQPLVVEVKDVQSDMSCEYYKRQGYTESQVPTYCPYAAHWYTECAQFDIQFSTDYTMDLPM